MGSNILAVGIHSGTVRHVAQASRAMLDSGDSRLWSEFCNRLDVISLRPVLSHSKYIVSLPGPSVLHVEDHCGFDGFHPTDLPTIDCPGFGWVIRTILIESANHKMWGRYEGLRGTLLDGLDRSAWIQSENESIAFSALVDTLFDTPAQAPEDQKFLFEDESFWSITGSTKLAALFNGHREIALRQIISRLVNSNEPNSASLGRELLRIVQFANLVLVDDLDLWVSEPHS